MPLNVGLDLNPIKDPNLRFNLEKIKRWMASVEQRLSVVVTQTIDGSDPPIITPQPTITFTGTDNVLSKFHLGADNVMTLADSIVSQPVSNVQTFTAGEIALPVERGLIWTTSASILSASKSAGIKWITTTDPDQMQFDTGTVTRYYLSDYQRLVSGSLGFSEAKYTFDESVSYDADPATATWRGLDIAGAVSVATSGVGTIVPDGNELVFDGAFDFWDSVQDLTHWSEDSVDAVYQNASSYTSAPYSAEFGSVHQITTIGGKYFTLDMTKTYRVVIHYRSNVTANFAWTIDRHPSQVSTSVTNGLASTIGGNNRPVNSFTTGGVGSTVLPRFQMTPDSVWHEFSEDIDFPTIIANSQPSDVPADMNYCAISLITFSLAIGNLVDIDDVSIQLLASSSNIVTNLTERVLTLDQFQFVPTLTGTDTITFVETTGAYLVPTMAPSIAVGATATITSVYGAVSGFAYTAPLGTLTVANAFSHFLQTPGFGSNKYNLGLQSGSFFTAFKTGTQIANVGYTLPDAAPTVSGQALVATTSGIMSWATAGTGPTGPAGPSGSIGMPGADGEDGVSWPIIGQQGSPGPAGNDGAIGPAGRPGLDGEDGDIGPIGPPGSTGPTGVAGIAGIQGPIGVPGIDGMDGSDGWPGPTGSTGLQGPAGIDGIPGRPGMDGLDGEDGQIGPPGIGSDLKLFKERSSQIVAAGTTLVAIDGFPITPFTSSGSVTSTAAPFIAAGRDGQLVILRNDDGTDTLTISDTNIGSGGSLLRLSASTVVMAAGSTMALEYSAIQSAWVELWYLAWVAVTPAINTHTINIGAGAASSQNVEVAGSGTNTPTFAWSFTGVPSAGTVDIDAGGGEVSGADYPATISTPFTSLTGPAFNKGTSVGTVRTFTPSITVNGVVKTTPTATVTYINRVYSGANTQSTILSSAQVLALTGTSPLSTVSTGTFTVSTTTSEFFWFAHRSSASTITFMSSSSEIMGFTDMGTITHTNASGFAETFRLYKSINTNFGASKSFVTSLSRLTNRIYYGSDPTTDPISTANILALDSSALQATVAGTFAITITGSDYLWFCHPSAISDIATIKDLVTGFAIGGAYRTNVSHTNAMGFTETYRCWRSSNPGIYPTGGSMVIT